jgi:hypothetical protein
MLLQPFANDAQLLVPFEKDPLFSEVWPGRILPKILRFYMLWRSLNVVVIM